MNNWDRTSGGMTILLVGWTAYFLTGCTSFMFPGWDTRQAAVAPPAVEVETEVMIEEEVPE